MEIYRNSGAFLGYGCFFKLKCAMCKCVKIKPRLLAMIICEMLDIS